MRMIIIVIALALASCSTSPRPYVKAETYEQDYRSDKLVQEYFASIMPGTEEGFVMPYSVHVDTSMTEAQKTAEIIRRYFELKNNQEGVMELNLIDAFKAFDSLPDILKGAVEFAIEAIVGERVPQPWNVFRWASYGKDVYLEDAAKTSSF